MKSSRLLKYFEQYVKEFDMNNINVKIKYFHSLKVMELCRDIATELQMFSEEEIIICELVGLFHDIGCFDSIKNFRITNDDIDCSNKSIEILFKKGIMRKIIADTKYDNLVKMLIYCHNKVGVPNQFDPKLQSFCKVIQDAHKIDTFRLVVNYPYIDMRIDKYPSSIVYNQFKIYKQIPSIIADNNADNVLVVLSNIFGIWYKFSYQYIYDNMYIKKIFNSLYYSNNECERFFNQLESVLDMFLKKKGGDYR